MPSGKPKEGESLADLFPDVASQWHPTLNGDLTPFDLKVVSHKKVWWKCDKGDDHQWDSQIKSRTLAGQVNHPFCVNQRVSSTNNLKALGVRLKFFLPAVVGSKNPAFLALRIY